MEAQTSAKNDHHDPFEEIVDNGEDGNAIEELEFDLNHFRKTRPDLAPENPDPDWLVDFDRDVATNEFRALSVDEIVKEYLPQPAEGAENICSEKDEVLNEPISPSSRNKVDGAIEILSRLTLFTTDSELDPLLQKVSHRINQIILDKMKQSSLNFFWNINSIDYVCASFCASAIFMVTVNNKVDICHKKEFVFFLSLYYLPLCFFLTKINPKKLEIL